MTDLKPYLPFLGRRVRISWTDPFGNPTSKTGLLREFMIDSNGTYAALNAGRGVAYLDLEMPDLTLTALETDS